MTRTLVLVRHGKAGKADVYGSDFDRELTPAGLAALKDAFPTTFAQLNGTDPAIWCSPAVRARQTAEAVAEAVGVSDEDIEEHDSLYEQNTYAFLDELYASDAPCVIAVGHIPFAEVVPRVMADVDLDFDPGAACALTFDGDDRSKPASVEWFVQGPEVEE